ncbi:uncharacterized protein SOCEGT47_063340 [Sorangium cellulosum]|uniref:Uncharacterized protein n=1 Tax=Sorangium cellulosum TaxID=56 RepID=A0A4V0NED4_SORCE|nr:hypothetical protein [Sorangium cellulosum]AUX25782.1 uncharacterized protein SOCEGT47_063340 [Sorangium cellulosum]
MLADSLVHPEDPPDLSDFWALRGQYLSIFDRVMAEHDLDALVFPQTYEEIPPLFSDATYAATTESAINIVDEARRRTGALPHGVAWEAAPRAVPPSLERHLGQDMAEGVGWKLVPLQRFPDLWELSLDNDVILWDLPAALAAWLDDAEDRCLIAEDVRVCLGQFADLLPPAPRNSGIRGLPPGFDLDAAMRAVLCERPARLTSELDEQGLQVAAVSRARPPLLVTTDEVSICSPFPPHQPDVDRAGAHFVGLNVRRLPFDFHGRPAIDVRAEHWERWRPYLYDRVGLPLEGDEGAALASSGEAEPASAR